MDKSEYPPAYTVLADVTRPSKRSASRRSRKIRPNLNVKVCERDAPCIIKCLEQCPTKWFTIGINLKMSKSELDKIEQDHPDTERKITEMIYEWIRNADEQFCTWKMLINAVETYDNEAAKSLRDYFTKQKETEIIESEREEQLQYRKEREKEAEEEKQTICQLLNDIRTKLKIKNEVSDDDVLYNIQQHVYDSKTLSSHELKAIVTKIDSLLGRRLAHLQAWVDEVKQNLQDNLFCKEFLSDLKQGLQIHLQHLQTDEKSLKARGQLKEMQKNAETIKCTESYLSDCINRLELASVDYKSICENLCSCQANIEHAEKLYKAMCAATESNLTTKDQNYLKKALGLGFAIALPSGILGGLAVGTVAGVIAGGVAWWWPTENQEQIKEMQSHLKLCNDNMLSLNASKEELSKCRKKLNFTECP